MTQQEMTQELAAQVLVFASCFLNLGQAGRAC